MTPDQEILLGKMWANMAREEGHMARVPNVIPPELRRLNQRRDQAPLTQRVIKLLRERGPMQASDAGGMLGLPKVSSSSTFNRLVKNNQIKRYKDDDIGRYIYYVGELRRNDMTEQIERIARVADILRLDAKSKGDEATHARASEILALSASLRRQHDQDVADRNRERDIK